MLPLVPSTLLALSTAASAQDEGLETGQLQPHLSVDGRHGAITDDAGVAGEFGPAGSFDATYTVNDIPEGVQEIEDLDDVDVDNYGDSLRADILVGYQFDFIRAGLDVPIYPETFDVNGGATAIGSTALDLRGTILDDREELFGLGVKARGWIEPSPGLSPDEPDDGGFEAAIVADDYFDNVNIGTAWNAGWREVDFDPDTGDDVGDSVFLRGVVKGDVSDRVALYLEGEGDLRYDREQLVNDEGWVSGQGLAGVAVGLTQGLDIEGRLGAIAREPASPNGEAVSPQAGVALSWRGQDREDADVDGIANLTDECMNRAEDMDGYMDNDGCLDADNDGDAIADTFDRCPDSAEDLDGFEDFNGCIDEEVMVLFKARAADGQMLDTYTVYIDGEPIELESHGNYMAAWLNPGKEIVAIDADGFRLQRLPVYVGADDTNKVDVMLERYIFYVENEPDMLAIDEEIHFRTDSAELKPRSKRVLTHIARELKRSPNITDVWIAGHTDDRGSQEYNEQLSIDRAKSVHEYLVNQEGIDAERLMTVGFGETKPQAPGEGPSTWRKNRRVEFHVTNNGSS